MLVSLAEGEALRWKHVCAHVEVGTGAVNVEEVGVVVIVIVVLRAGAVDEIVLGLSVVVVNTVCVVKEVDD